MVDILKPKIVPINSKEGLAALLNRRGRYDSEHDEIEIYRQPDPDSPDFLKPTTSPSVELMRLFLRGASDIPLGEERKHPVFMYDPINGEGKLE